MSGENLGDLNEYLFRQLDRLDQADPKDEQGVRVEVMRARAACDLGQAIVDSGTLYLKALKESSMTGSRVPRLLEVSRDGGR